MFCVFLFGALAFLGFRVLVGVVDDFELKGFRVLCVGQLSGRAAYIPYSRFLNYSYLFSSVS